MNRPLISIIMPTYNHELFIQDAIQSVINQNYDNWELIIIDDGSTDNTGTIASSYQDIDDRIKYFYQSNLGIFLLERTYNFALSKCNGEYVAILEGDDFWVFNKLQMQVEHLNDDIILSWGRVIEYISNEIGEISFPKTYSAERKNIFENEGKAKVLELMLDDFPVPLTWIIKKSALTQIGGFMNAPNMPSVDRMTLYNLSLLGKFKYHDEVLGYYRRSRNQVTRKHTVELTESSVSLLQNFYENLDNESKKNLKITSSDILKVKEKALVICHFRKGRYHLLYKEYKEGRDEFMYCINGIKHGLISWKFKSIIGVILSYMKLDYETIAKFLGKNQFVKMD